MLEGKDSGRRDARGCGVGKVEEGLYVLEVFGLCKRGGPCLRV